MAVKYADDAMLWPWSGQWCDDDDGDQDVATPQAGDQAYITANAGIWAMLDVTTNTLGLLDMTGYTDSIIMGLNSIGVDGNAILDGGLTSAGSPGLNVTGDVTMLAGFTMSSTVQIIFTGTGTIIMAGVTGGKLHLDAGAGTHTAGDAQVWTQSLIVTGTLDLANFPATLGNLTGTGGTLDFGTAVLTNTGKTINGANITCVTEANTPGVHAKVHEGTLQNVAVATDKRAVDATDKVANGTGCTNIWWSGSRGIHAPIHAGAGLIGAGKAA